MRTFIRWILRRLRRGRLERDIADEIRHHIELETELLEAGGMAPAAARRQARMRFGCMEATAEDLRRQHGLAWLDDAIRDTSLALRGFTRRPGLPLAVAATLALGIGSGTAVFAAVNAVLLEPPVYEAPDRLLFVWRTDGSGNRLRVPGPDAAAVRDGVPGLEAVAFLSGIAEASLARGGEPALPLRVGSVSGNWFDVLGGDVSLGRGFRAEDGRPGAAPVWLLDDGFFRTRLGADSSVLGRTLELDGRAGTVIGVLSPGFRLQLPALLDLPPTVDVWEPLTTDLAGLRRPDRETDQDSDDAGIMVARLAAGVSHARVQQGLDAVAARLRAQIPAYAEAGWGLEARSVHDDLSARARPVLHAVSAAVLLVLLLSAANAAGLLLTRSVARSRELAMRAALGARSGRLARQLVLEHALLVLAGTAAGLAFALLVLRATASRLASLAPGTRAEIDSTVVAFVAMLAFAVTAVTSAVVLFDPALSRSPGALRATRGATEPRSARRLRAGLLALQVAVSLALVIGATVMTRTAASLAATDLGFRTPNVLAFRVGMAFPDRYRGPAERAALVGGLETAMRAVPGVEAVGLVGALPLADPGFTQPWAPADAARSEWGRLRANYRVVTSGWFDAMGTRVVEGRAFRPEDDRQDRRVVIVDGRLARRLAPGGSAVGQALRVPVDGDIVTATVVGVVEDVRYESPSDPGRETVYVPYRHEASRRVAFVVRTRSDPHAFARPLAEAIAGVDPGIAMHDARPLSAIVDAALRPARDVTTMLAAFACVALVLALVALHAAVAWGVQRRTAEIGLRLALGATRGEVVAHAMRAGLVPCAAGLAAGLALVLAGAPVLRGLVHGVSPLDPPTLAGATLALAAACALASRVAARHAARVEPAVALAGGE